MLAFCRVARVTHTQHLAVILSLLSPVFFLIHVAAATTLASPKWYSQILPEPQTLTACPVLKHSIHQVTWGAGNGVPGSGH